MFFRPSYSKHGSPGTRRFVYLSGVLIIWLLVICPAAADGQCYVTATFSFKPANGSSPSLRNPLSPGAVAPLKIVAFGDSVMWGNGLTAPEKFVYLFGRMMADLTGRPVDITSFAHSGAKLYPIDGDSDIPGGNEGSPQGDLDSGNPTTIDQEKCAAVRFSDAEIVLLDGCINNVGATKIALPVPFNFTTKEKIAHDAAACGPFMANLLKNALADFKNATIVVINYYRIASSASTPFVARNGGPPPVQKGSSSSEVKRLIKEQEKLVRKSGKQREFAAMTQSQALTFQSWDENSAAFLATTETCFKQIIASANLGSSDTDCVPLFDFPSGNAAEGVVPGISGTGSGPTAGPAQPLTRVFLARVPDKPEFAYGAPHKHLWRLAFHFLFWTCADDMYSNRKKLCDRYFHGDAVKKYKCSINPLAHPNVTGAQFYSDSLLTIFRAAWHL